MSSEDKTVEPSDQGPLPPSSSVGATSTGSPAHADKRPRGRPRKDGAAILPQAPSSSLPKNRKKGRTRGRVVVDEEDSMDGSEITESVGTQDTETQILPAETVEEMASEVPEKDEPSCPLAQSPPAENSAGPSVPGSREVKSSKRLCAFCFCGGRSLLGQGDLQLFCTMPQLEALFSQKDGGGSTSDGSDGDKTTQPKMAEETTSGQKEKTNESESCEEEPEPDPASRFWDELSHVGLPQDFKVQSLFESGQCWAHQSCALWSEGVCEGEGQSLLNVDRAIDSGSTKHCAYCKRLGASIKCCAEGCAQHYHYPCAGAAGTFQDIRSLSLLCPEHIELAIHKFVDDVNCALCDSPGDLLDQLFCTSCGQHYHGICLDMAVTPLRRAGWQCPECKVCQTCKNPGEDTKMLVCDMCDKGYHTFCLQPAIDSLPTNGWRCKSCRVCLQCGTRTSGQWHHTSLLCENCVQNQDPALSCPTCTCILDPEHHKDLLFCHTCKRWLHLECERQNSGQAEIHPREDYVCSSCKSPAAEQALQAEDMDTGPELSPQPVSMHTDSESSLQLAQKHTDLEPGTQQPPEMHNDPEPELLAVPLHSDPEPAQATVQEEKLATSAQMPEVSVVADVERQVTEPSVNKVLTEFKPETKPAARTQLTPTESPASSTTPWQELETFPAQVSAEALQSQDTTLKIKPAITEVCSEQGMANPSTKDFKAIISATKEPSTAPVPFMDQPVEVSLLQPPIVDVVRTSFLETAPEDLEEMKDGIFHRNLAETVNPSASSTSEEMDTTLENTPNLSFPSLFSEERPLKTSVERLVEMVSASSSHSSSLLRGTCPRELPQIQILPSLGDHSSITPTTTLIPLTPKIGMGKPAITKRKFSPGRPRVKQGAWSPHSSVSSPLSWSPDQSEGWDVPKTRQSSGSPGWSIRVGRGSGFPGRRRPRGAGLSGRAGRGRARGKNGVPCPSINPGITTIETPYQVKEEEENAMHNTVVIFSSNDNFTLKQDMCVVCGSFGLGAEGRLLACAQCGQCYHPFCVGIKITKVVLSKGWRCLECTVCEACGQATDPGRLLLCDDCDISYHTYCLDPPLQNVPKDSWKCKWCVSCTQCGATTPGLRCEWQNNYTHCAPCASLPTCPICLEDYSEGTIVVQCRQCDRWFHASCQGLHSEEDVEKAADSSFDCTMCRAFKTTKVVTKARDAIEPVVMMQTITKAKEMDLSRTYTQDGVCLTESGLCQLQSLSATASRRRKPKPKLKLKIINQNSVAVLQPPVDPLSEHSRDEDMEDNREAELIDCEAKSDSSLEREPVEDDSKGPDGGKKRKRKPYRPGIGGFMVRQRSRPGQGPGKAKRPLCRKDSSGSVSENPTGKDDGWTEALPDTPVDEMPPGQEVPEKIKKRYRKKKTKLEEAFPTYLQEAFFGKDLLDKSKQTRQQGVESGLLEEGQSHVERKHNTTSFMGSSSDPLLSASATSLPTRPTAAQTSEEPLVDLSDVLNTDADILGMLGKSSNDSGLDFCPFQVDSSPPPFAGLDIGSLSDSSPVAPHSQAGRRTPRTLPEEPLDGILSPELDKMVTDESILSKLYKIPELEGKDVEDLFTAVLSPSTSQPPPPPQLPHPQGPGPHPATPGTSMPHPNTGNPMFPRMPMINGMMGPNQRFPTNPGAGPCIPENFSPLNRMPFSDNPRDRKFNQMPREAVGPWTSPGHCPGPTPPGSLPEAETEAMSNAQRSTLKWEKEETLGELATVAPVLYTNVNFPNLKEEYPDWSTRVKQIAKLWRKASSQDRAPYVQKARDNRAALRINKVQMSNETVKRHHPQQQPPEVFDPNIPLDTELLFKDPLKTKESEHEQEWKFRQQMRQKSKQQAKIEATQKLEQVKNEQLQQQQQQQQQCNSQSEGDGNISGNQSPASQPSNGSMSPMQQLNSKEAFARPQLPGTPTSGLQEDVFLRPPPPPPSGPSSQPQSPQVFSPGSSGSRPSSPWDPYAKMVGTPRPPTLGPNACRRIAVESGKSPTSLMEQQDRGRPSPAHESFGSPTSMSSDPYAKPPDTPRPCGEIDPFLKPMGPPRASQAAQGRPPMGSPGRDSYSRPMIRNEAYQRMAQNRMILSDPYSRPLLTPIPGSNESGSVPLFKTPMPPPQTQDPFSRPGLHPSDRYPQNPQNDPFAQPLHTPRPSGNDNFTSPPRMSQHHPQGHSFVQPGPMTQMSRNPYAHAPSTPRPDHFTYDPFAQPSGPNKSATDPFSQSAVNQRQFNESSAQSRPFFEPYARPPGTPRPHDNYGQPSNNPSPSSDPYSQAPSTPRPSGMNQFTHQAHPGQRMSPSHAVDPYAQPPGTPRPSVGERFSKSPGSQRGAIEPFTSTPGTSRPGNSDMFSQPGTPRPMLNDPYAQPPGTPRPGPDGLSRQVPRPGPMGSQDPFQSPQGRHQEPFAHPGSQTPKHLIVSEDGFTQSPSRRPGQTPGHDPFEHAPMTPHPQSTEKMEMKDQSGVGNNVTTPQEPGQLSNNPQIPGASSEAHGVALAETEERLRQRQRIRELILKQQQQRSAIRQERGPQEPTGSSITQGAPRPWPLEGQGEIFNRPPPPYPGQGPVRGPMRFPGPFPGDPRISFPNEGQMPRGPHLGDPNLRHQGPRFAFPPGVIGPHGPQEFFPRGQHPMQDVPPQMRRSMSAEMAKSMGGNPIGIPQHFPPRGMPMQQHNIMGQPFIELRHRAAENRPRMPFPQGPMQGSSSDSNLQVQRPAGFPGAPDSRFPLNQGSRMIDHMSSQTGHVQLSASMDNLHQQTHMSANTLKQSPLMRSMSQPASNETQNMMASMTLTAPPAGHAESVSVPSSDAVEEKLDAEESAVKDLEDVEVKDLVDADLENLNLDPEDSKDLDLETNDLHLDDFLTSGKFDIIAYTDPDLDDIKKDMFNEELDLSDPIDDNADSTTDINKTETEASSSSASALEKSEASSEQSLCDVKLEAIGNQDSTAITPGKEIKTEVKDCQKQPEVVGGNTLTTNQQGLFSDSTPVLSSLLIKQQPEEQSLNQIVESVSHGGNLMPQQNQVTDTQNTSGLAMSQTISDNTAGESSMTGFEADHQAGITLGVDPTNLSQAQQAALNQALGQHGQLQRPLLLEEQPLLLQDLLDQERQEQQQQRQMQAMIRQRSSDSFFPNIDFDAITDPIMKAKMVALKGINKVMVQNNMGMPPVVMNRFPPGPGPGPGPVPPCPESTPLPPKVVGQDGKLTQVVRPNPPNFGPGFVNNAQRAQYEEWLQETQQLLQMQQKFLEEKIGAHRKSKKALSAKQRTAKKAGREFPEEDAEQLKHVTEQQGVVQKQLEQIRKQQKEHAELIEEYRVKQQQNSMTPIMPGMHPMPGPAGMGPSGPTIVQPPMNPMMQVPLHPGQTNIPPRMPNPPPGWHPGAPMPMGGPGMPPIMPPQVPVGNPGQHHQMPMGNMPQHPQMAVEPQAASVPPGGVKPMQGGGVKFDDNNPFSEGFQERERRERLREQQERQRVQLMQEVERQRALKHRMEMEQQGMMGPDVNMAPLTQMPFYNAELPQDFMQPQRPPLQQQPLGPVFPQQQGMQPGMGSPPGAFMQGDRRALMGNGMMPPDIGPGFGPDNLPLQAPNFPQGQPRPRQFSGPGMMPGETLPFDSSTPLPSNFPGSGQSLIQLYSNIIPDEKGKKKRSRKKKKDDDADSVKTPSTPHSDLTAPLTPCVSDTSSTPTRNTHLFGDQDLSRSPLLGSSTPSHSELERQLSGGGQSGQSGLTSDTAKAQAQEHDRILNNIKLEQIDASECHGPIGSEMSYVKEEGSKGSTSPFPAGQSPSKGEAGNELLKHLLKNKTTPPSGLPQQRLEESLRSEEEEPVDCKSLLRQSSMDSNGAYSDGTLDFPGPLLPEQEKKKGRNKRAPKGGEKPASRYKKRKKEGDERQLMHSGNDAVMTQIKQQLSLLPLMEPLIGVNFAHFAPYGSGQLNGENLLSGTFGSASLDGVSDYYSQLAYKQSNLSNPPTPPASLPPTPPPVNRQKMINGFATTEELASKAAAMVSKGLVPKPLHVPFRTEEDLLARAIAQGPKTVDVPASLPTPPHNNQEELSNRGQEPCKDRDTPDSFVPSSSPESVVGMEISRYPDLSLVKEEPPSPCLSPVLPMLPPPDGKGSVIKLQDIKSEPSAMFFGSPFDHVSNESKQRLVSVAITLRPAAAENITGVVAAISDLLCVKIPSSYEVSSTPDRGPLSMHSGHKMGPHGMEPRPPVLFHGHGDNGGLHGRPGHMIRPGGAQAMMQQQQQQAHHFRFHPNSPGAALLRGPDQKTPASPGCKPQWCCHCKVVVLGNGVQKSIKDIPAHMKESEGRLKSEEDLVFCSHSCFLLFCSSPPLQSRTASETKQSVSLLPASQQTECLSKAQHQYSNNMSSLDVHCLAQLQPKQSPPSTPPIPFPPAGETPKMELKSDAIKVTVKLKARPRSHDGWNQGKRQKGLRWRKWTVQIVVPRGNSQLPDEDKIDDLLKKLGASLRTPALLRDHRRCCFCHQFGDGNTDGPARLLNLDLDVWVHLNCALWSTEVYETQAGALINVELALRRGQTVRCAYCQQTGATSGCHRLRCTNVYHFTCALQAQCTFFKDKTMLCHAHRPRGTAGQALEHELRCFAVFRRVYVQRDELRQIAAAVRHPELGYTFRVGSLVLHAMGQLTPPQMAAFHSTTAIFPIGYEACRIYWSMRHGNRRCRYICSVEEREGLPEFTIRVIEQGYQDLLLTDNSVKGVWDKVLGPVAEKRAELGTLKLFPVYLKGEDLFGLTVPAVTKITESLPGVEACDRYSFRYGRNPLVEVPIIFNPAGSARAQPRTSSLYTSLIIRPHPQAVSSSNARSNQNVAQGEGGAPHSKPPVVHPRSSQYRWMKSEWRANVYLGRSRIQGLGLFSAREIEKQTMVIEYNGTILRNEVAIRKEKTYRAQNREVFMFRIDSEHIVDATRTGGLARYINHSCAPNCVAEVVTFERGYKIIITCNRRLEKGEELCFDYQFDAVEDRHKIACQCGAPECRKWIN
ncbi:histone-lysine N-methyltransferase 2C-like isoform X3 [Solea senegalensis]|uniref:[histone H3]-lysine(4) N-methyltransferase n=2 Tax=Solea senegalensis TaxID=28829 RepID=A0AAV6TBW3_SOLSE|nr:histone-lysine N-methyltransferase 2C-like isoform X3 [Solea senegalensis]KAG7526834.1 histone-lysine N-methyltransferase 2C-like isoform X3 [Solea senegalensis]